MNWSLASYEDVGEFFQNELFKDTAAPGTTLQDVMATSLTTTTPDAKKGDIKSLFSDVSEAASQNLVLLCTHFVPQAVKLHCAGLVKGAESAGSPASLCSAE